MAKKKPAKPAMTSVGVRYLAVCTDGKTVADWEKENAANAGMSVEDWRKKVEDTLANADAKDVASTMSGMTYANQAGALAGRFNDVAAGMQQMNYDSPDKLQDLLEGKVSGLEAVGVDGSGYNQYKRPMWTYLQKKGLVVDRNWQHTTAVSWVGPGGRRLYGTNMTPYVVRRSGTPYDWKKGSIVKIADKSNPSNFVYAQVLGAGPSNASQLEMSQGVYSMLGYPTDGSSTPAGLSGVDYSLAASGGQSGNINSMLSSDQIQLAGALGDQKMLTSTGRAITQDDLTNSVGALDDKQLAALDKSLNDGARRQLAAEQKKLAAQKAGKTADATPTAPTNKLLKGYPTVFGGETIRAVGYANAACIHDGGGYVAEGSECVYVGRYPLARIGDSTNDEKKVATGNESIYVGGSPTSATMSA